MRGGGIGSGWIFLALLLPQLGCEEEKKAPPPLETKKVEEPAEEPSPEPVSPPHLMIGESGAMVRGMSAMLTQPSGVVDAQGRGKLNTYLGDEKKFIEGQEVRLMVDRTAQPIWVSIYLSALSELAPSRIIITTETRSDFPKELEFVPEEKLSSPPPCSLVGTITEDRGTAIWKLSGGTAHKRGRGMGGPDLSMTAETIQTMKKGCDSDLFFVTGVGGIEWGLLYDLAASAVALQDAGLKRVVIPTRPATAGHKVQL